MTALSTSLTPTPELHLGELAPLAALDEQRRRRILGIFLIAGAVFVTMTGAFFAILAGRITWSSAVTAGIDVGLITSWFLRRRALAAACVLTLTTLVIAFPLTMLQWGGLRAPVLIGLPLAPVLVASFAGARGAAWLSALLALGTLGVWIATWLGLVPPSLLPEHGRDAMSALFALGSIVFAAYAARETERERKQLEATLHDHSRAHYQRSVHDPLTQLYNRRYLSHRLDEELAFAARHATDLGVILLDVDHFKEINDRYGHGAGDETLVALGRALHGGVRREDVVARYGGEEFAIVLRGLDLPSIALAAERIRRAIEDHTFVVEGRRLPLTVSAGCSTLSCCGEPTVTRLLAVADARLYRAKQSGRNRVAFTD